MAVVIILALQGTSMAVQVTATWNGGAGNWSNIANWDAGVVPSNGINTYDVRIDNGNVTNSSVTLDMTATIDKLTVDAPDSLNFNNGQGLTIAGGSVTNNGVISMNSTGTATDLKFNGGITLSGTGGIVMSDNTQNRIITNSTLLTQAASHTIRGAGQLLANTGGMINNGTIIQEGATAMTIDPNALEFTNQGTMQATGAGGFVFSPGVFTNTGQTIAVQHTSKLDLSDGVTVDGGTLQTAGSGVINQLGIPGGAAVLNNVTIAGTVVQANSKFSTITGGLTNNGTWNLNSLGSTTDLNFNGGITLSGSGEIVMSDNTQNRIITNSTLLTQAASHTIRGAGQLLANTGGMINNGTIIQEGATAMTIDPNALEFTNQGTMQATGAGGFVFSPGVFTNTGQTIAVQHTSKLDLSDGVTVDGGTLQTAGSGVINQLGVAGGAVLNNVTIAGTVNQANSKDSTITGGLTNNGTWNLNSTGTATDLKFNGGTILDGVGKIVMSNNLQNRILTNGFTLTQAANHTIEGAGQIFASLTNNGTVEANQVQELQLSVNNNKTNNVADKSVQETFVSKKKEQFKNEMSSAASASEIEEFVLKLVDKGMGNGGRRVSL
jgi:hypothetical protein